MKRPLLCLGTDKERETSENHKRSRREDEFGGDVYTALSTLKMRSFPHPTKTGSLHTPHLVEKEK